MLLMPALLGCHAIASARRTGFDPGTALGVSGNTIRIFCVGDVMTGRGIDQILPHPGNSAIEEPWVRDAAQYVTLAERAHGRIPRSVSFDYPWGDALDQIAACSPDIRLANLETSVTTSTDRAPKDINYKMSPANAECLSVARLGCVTLANNHVLDWGLGGLSETLRALHLRGIQTVGAGQNADDARRPAVFELSTRGRVLVFGFALEASGVPSGWAAGRGAGVFVVRDLSRASLRELTRCVTAFKRTGDLAIASVHWGSNWGYDISAEQQKFARALIDEGEIDLVHGHSSHHPRRIECHHRKLILYGCGDFINDYEGISGNEGYRPNLRLMYFPLVRPHSGDLLALKIRVLVSRRLRLQSAVREDVTWMHATLARESASLHFEIAPDGSIDVLPS